MAAERSSSRRGSPSSGPPLHKGRACINCRRRKIKCDGVKPVCGPCSRSSQSFRDCEYSDAGFTRTQILEEQIAVLEARLEELESPEEGSGSLTLFNPYSDTHASHSRALSEPNTPSSGGSEAVPLAEQPIPEVLHQALVHTFLHHSSQLGFFLDPARFATLIMDADGRNDLSPSLLHTVYLLGCHLSSSRSSDLWSKEQAWVSRALQSTAQALSRTPSQAVLQVIQAEVLLANYFFWNDRILEGKYHTSAATSLVLSAGLHKLHSADQQQPSSQLLGAPVLPPPRDSTEQGERINAFWTVLILNNCWTTADGSPSNVAYGASGSRIDAPWPLDITAYQQTQLTPATHTVQNFLAGNRDNGTSLLALHAKASILYEQSARLVRQYQREMSQQEAVQFSAAFTSLDKLISNFVAVLPSVQLSGNPTLLAIHILAHVAAIQLHKPFIVQNPASRVRLIASATSVAQVIRDLDLAQFSFIDPILGPLWAATCRAFMSVPEQHDLVPQFDTVSSAMAAFTQASRLMESQLSAMPGSS